MADYATGYGTNTGQKVVDYALGKAQETVPTNTTSAMPAWYGNQLQGPVNNQFTGYVQNANPYTAQSYDSLYKSLAGAAGTAYDRSLVEGDNRYGANGLYGSQGQSLQSDYMGQAQKTYQQGLLDAASKANEAADTSNQFAYKAGTTDSTLQNTYNQQAQSYNNTMAQSQIDFINSKLSGQYQYDLAKNTDAQKLAQQQYENYLALATGASPNAASNLNASTSAANTNAMNSAANTNALYSGLGAVGGGLLSNKSVTSGIGNVASSIWDTASGWFS